LPVTANFLTAPPGAGGYDSASLGTLRIDWLVGVDFGGPTTPCDQVELGEPDEAHRKRVE
jgi:hypothetical protein